MLVERTSLCMYFLWYSVVRAGRGEEGEERRGERGEAWMLKRAWSRWSRRLRTRTGTGIGTGNGRLDDGDDVPSPRRSVGGHFVFIIIVVIIGFLIFRSLMTNCLIPLLCTEAGRESVCVCSVRNSLPTLPEIELDVQKPCGKASFIQDNVLIAKVG